MEYSVLVYGHNKACLKAGGGAQVDSGAAVDKLVQKSFGSNLKLVNEITKAALWCTMWVRR